MHTAIVGSDNVVSQDDFVLGFILANGFRMKSDGWLYPQGAEPLVRVCITGPHYQMERRRKPQSVWMQIVRADISDFDTAAFEDWVEHWPLVA